MRSGRTTGISGAPAALESAWGQRVGGFTAVPALIRKLGGDPIAILDAVGLPTGVLDHAEGRIPYAAMGTLFQESAKRTGCAHFGLLCGSAWHLSDLGLVGELVRNSPTLGSALRTLTVYQHLNSEGGLAFLLGRNGVIDLGYAIYHPRVIGADQIYDAAIGIGCNFLRELCGTGWDPLEVILPHGKPPNINPYRLFFRAPLRFDAEFGALRFPAHLLEQSVNGADPERFRAAEKQAESAERGELLQQTYRALRSLLLRGNSSGNDVAQMLAMHRRTLNRRLKARGTTFQDVLDEVRLEVARQLLADTRAAIDDIAVALGYASASSFTRSFRRWTGATPSQWRRTAAG